MTTHAPSTLDTTTARARVRATDQRRRYHLYRSVPTAEEYGELLELEDRWITPLATACTASAPPFRSRADLLRALRERLALEEASPSPEDRFLAEEATLEQFRTVVAEFAVDGLTESEYLLPVVPRLPFRAGMAVFRVLIDELGSGNDEQAHSHLYRELLTELGMPLDLGYYVERACPEALAYVNMFHWLASRAPSPEYFLGGYAYFESSVLYAFRSYQRAAERLGIRAHGYYSEHLYIDSFHSRQMRTAIRVLDEENSLDLARVWAGVELTSTIAAAAVEGVVDKAGGTA
ncbi:MULTISPECIES: iron-containing redox enzyme family protein [unclassified Nocardiopsis]|uniref:iron-containing redox enzyme family protein n=1 Tax=unclassified Nocardiopsis TaxID=2649073 RepID=UPI001358346E|nr:MULTISPECIES: iron-containing redox enzyme family protein [unclassified Nocardiopsis]